jgi:uncharacterized membrane protein
MRQPLASLNLPAKIALALVSAGSYGLLTFLSERSATLDMVLSKANTGMHLVSLIFGALVMVPYAASSGRWPLRGAAMCVASAAIYYVAVRFVVDGPLNDDTMTSFAVSGAGAALLTGLTVVVLGPRVFRARLVPLMLVAGAAGGFVFDHKFSIDEAMLLGHLAWQTLVCLALHFSFRDTTT